MRVHAPPCALFDLGRTRQSPPGPLCGRRPGQQLGIRGVPGAIRGSAQEMPGGVPERCPGQVPDVRAPSLTWDARAVVPPTPARHEHWNTAVVVAAPECSSARVRRHGTPAAARGASRCQRGCQERCQPVPGEVPGEVPAVPGTPLTWDPPRVTPRPPRERPRPAPRGRRPQRGARPSGHERQERTVAHPRRRGVWWRAATSR